MEKLKINWNKKLTTTYIFFVFEHQGLNSNTQLTIQTSEMANLAVFDKEKTD